jgi:hypothetical protein
MEDARRTRPLRGISTPRSPTILKTIETPGPRTSSTTTMNRYGHVFDSLDATLIDELDAAHDKAAALTDNVTGQSK